MSTGAGQRGGRSGLLGGPAAKLTGGLVVVAAIAWAVVRFGAAPSPPTAAERWAGILGERSTPSVNVVLVTIDTLRVDRLSCYGADQVSTPAIDRLAAEGVRFSNAT